MLLCPFQLDPSSPHPNKGIGWPDSHTITQHPLSFCIYGRDEVTVWPKEAADRVWAKNVVEQFAASPMLWHLIHLNCASVPGYVSHVTVDCPQCRWNWKMGELHVFSLWPVLMQCSIETNGRSHLSAALCRIIILSKFSSTNCFILWGENSLDLFLNRINIAMCHIQYARILFIDNSLPLLQIHICCSTDSKEINLGYMLNIFLSKINKTTVTFLKL